MFINICNTFANVALCSILLRARSVFNITSQNVLTTFACVCIRLQRSANWFDANFIATNGHQSFLNISQDRFFFVLVGYNNGLWKKRSFYSEIDVENMGFSSEIAKKPFFRHDFLDNYHVWTILKAKAR